MMLCPRCGSAQTHDSGGTGVPPGPPPLRDVTRSLNCVAVFGVIGIAWHVLWIVAAGFLVAAFVDGSWNGTVWPQLHAAWEESHACEACRSSAPPDSPA
jgi:hypothetical protein